MGLRWEDENGQVACDSPLTLCHHAEHCLAAGKRWSRKGEGGALAASVGPVHPHSAIGRLPRSQALRNRKCSHPDSVYSAPVYPHSSGFALGPVGGHAWPDQGWGWLWKGRDEGRQWQLRTVGWMARLSLWAPTATPSPPQAAHLGMSDTLGILEVDH